MRFVENLVKSFQIVSGPNNNMLANNITIELIEHPLKSTIHNKKHFIVIQHFRLDPKYLK